MESLLKRLVIRKLVIGFLISTAYLLILNGKTTLLNISNSLFIVGMVYLIIGLFRLTKKLELYNFIAFGWKKMIEIIKNKDYSSSESKSGDYYTYTNSQIYDKSFNELIVSGLIMIAISIIVGL